MAAEEVLNLLDAYWFETTLFTNKRNPSPFHSVQDSDSISQPQGVEEALPLGTYLQRIPTLQVIRSFSDQTMNSNLSVLSDYSPSPNSVLTPAKLLPILSGKEMNDEFPLERSTKSYEEEQIPNKRRQSQRHSHGRRLRKGKTSRSLSELELQELKGFMDLGFVFSEEDKDSGLVSLIPGLQRLGREEDAREGAEQKEVDETGICRPYLSEAWGVLEQRREVNTLLNWRVPAVGSEIDVKDNLRFWVHTVASIVR